MKIGEVVTLGRQIQKKMHCNVTPIPNVGVIGDVTFLARAARSTRPWWKGMPPRMVRTSLGHILNSSVVVWKDIPGGAVDMPKDMAVHIDHIVERLPR